MAIIYTNSNVSSCELKPESLLENFENHADKLESIARHYRKLVSFIREKNIEILETHGSVNEGRFLVDEIDTGRLKQAGCVVDFGEHRDDDPVFYTDETLDKIINDIDDMDGFDDETIKEIEILLDDDDDEIEVNDVCYESKLEVEVFKNSISEISRVVNIKEIFSEDLSEIKKPSDVIPGFIGIDVTRTGERKFTFNLVTADLMGNPSIIKFDRGKCLFKYKCSTCDQWHYESLDSVFRSLKTATALLSNLIKMIDIDHKEFAIALDFIDHDLRLLQPLLKFDYALDDLDDSVADLGDEEFEFDDDEDDDDDEDE
jgi:hypothetical protein